MWQRLKDRVFHFYSSEQPAQYQTALLILAGLSVFLYTKQEVQWFFYPAVITYGLALLIVLGLSIMSIKYSYIRLFLYKRTGELFDLRYRLRNVALRTRTVCLELSEFETKCGQDALYDTGKRIGDDFFENLAKGWRERGKNLEKEGLREKLQEWVMYDSTSGMGNFNFDIESDSPISLKVTIDNAFTISECDLHQNLCKFLAGYVAGFCIRASNRRNLKCVEQSCGRGASRRCNFLVSEN